MKFISKTIFLIIYILFIKAIKAKSKKQLCKKYLLFFSLKIHRKVYYSDLLTDLLTRNNLFNESILKRKNISINGMEKNRLFVIYI